MNKKWLIGLCIVLGVLILGTAAYAISSGSDGYDTYKTALKNTWVVQSLTGTLEVSATDNGNTLLTSRNVVKTNLGSKDLSGYFTVSANGQESAVEIYRQDEEVISRMGGTDEYNAAPRVPNKYQAEYNLLKENAAEVEKVINLLAYKLDNYITVEENEDGSRDVSLQLTANQITQVQNAVVSLLVKSGVAERGNGPIAALIEQNLPALVDNIKLTGINLQARVNADNLIEQQTVNINIAGTDAYGNAHNIAVSMNLDLSDFNNTIPDTPVR